MASPSIGPVTGGLPRLGLPALIWREIAPLIPIAGSFFATIVAQSAATLVSRRASPGSAWTRTPI